MRRIINSTYITLDGVIERPHEWPSIGSRGSKGDEIQAELLLGCDALLMGRRTYEAFAPVWPTRSGDPVSEHINSMAKYVVSSTLSEPEWNNTYVIRGCRRGDQTPQGGAGRGHRAVRIRATFVRDDGARAARRVATLGVPVVPGQRRTG